MNALVIPQISKILEDLIGNTGVSEAEVARRVGIPAATLNKLKTGVISNPTMITLEKIARYFEITIEQLLGNVPMERQFSNHLYCIPFIESHRISEVSIPQLDYVNHKEWKRVELSSETYNKDLFATRVVGDAMRPLFDENTIVVVNSNSELQSRKYVLVRINQSNEIIIRKLLVDGKDRILQPLNTSFPSISLHSDDCILGVVIASIKDYEF